MYYIICRDCKQPALVKPFAKGEGYFLTKNPQGCQCGTDQRRSKPFQKWIEENKKETVAELATYQKPVENPKTQETPEETNQPKKTKSSKLWWLLLPVAALGLGFAKLTTGGKK
jgi:hypothetical protein